MWDFPWQQHWKNDKLSDLFQKRFYRIPGRSHVCQYNGARSEKYFIVLLHSASTAPFLLSHHDGTRRETEKNSTRCRRTFVESCCRFAFPTLSYDIENSTLLHIKLCDFFFGTKFAWGSVAQMFLLLSSFSLIHIWTWKRGFWHYRDLKERYRQMLHWKSTRSSYSTLEYHF